VRVHRCHLQCNLRSAPTYKHHDDHNAGRTDHRLAAESPRTGHNRTDARGLTRNSREDCLEACWCRTDLNGMSRSRVVWVQFVQEGLPRVRLTLSRVRVRETGQSWDLT